MKNRVLAAVIAAICLLRSDRVDAQSIGIFFDADAATCSRVQLQNTAGTLWILALLNGAAAGGITGAELRMTGFPAGWLATTAVAASAVISIGAPQNVGAIIAFPSCQPGTNGIQLLYRIEYFANTLLGPTYLTITGHSSPGNRLFNCPVVTLCDFPTFTKVCASGGQGILNGPPCTIATAVTTWSAVKGLFQ